METLTHKLYSTLRQFCKDNQIKMNDPKFITACKNIFLELHPSDYQPSLPNLKDLPKPIVELYEAFVQQSIDMIRNNPDIKEKLIEEYKVKDLYCVNIGCAICSHIGPGVLAISCI